MKNTKIIFLFILIIIIGMGAFYLSKKNPQVSKNPKEEESSILGCYVVRSEKDVYTMHLESENGNVISGTMDFNNFEKDSSSGVFVGAYNDGILVGEYYFNSEGMDSVMQLIFKKEGDDFVRGYGEVDSQGANFIDLDSIEYDELSPLSFFKKEACLEKEI